MLNDEPMDLRRLRFLLELARRGSMREVADELGVTTSTVSQQIAALAKGLGTTLLEQHGRGVRLTPAGHRLAGHAVTILAAVEAAGLDLDPDAEPAGTIRVAGFASAVRRSLLPMVIGLAESHPRVRLMIHEHEPAEAFALLADDAIDLALIYDYNLAPLRVDAGFDVRALWSTPWGLGVPADRAGAEPAGGGPAATTFARFAQDSWIVNSRNTADADVVRAIATMAGFEPDVKHRADSLELVEDLIAAGLGVGLLPEGRASVTGVHVLPLADPGVRLRSYVVTRAGRAGWPPLALILGLLSA